MYLVGAGPGDPGLMTLRGKGLLEQADAVIYDALISPPILAMINPDAEKIDGGKRPGRHTKSQTETTQLLIDLVQRHGVVVRLKGGDPFMFGRGGEEMSALREAGIEVEVVPGITAGIAAPAYAEIPVTHREYSSSVVFVTGHEATQKYRPAVNWSAIAAGAETIVIYMGIQNLPNIIAALITGGLSPATPIALIRWGTWPEQTELVGTLDSIVEQLQAQDFSPPAIAVIGNVIHYRQQLQDLLPLEERPNSP